mmetsp:Transcript_128704/g.305392  ORF Transcript_128704/g.305392 Transcript_128704/m.305392 type:complete len:204 (+) Transcript_128704:487-1098(+)
MLSGCLRGLFRDSTLCCHPFGLRLPGSLFRQSFLFCHSCFLLLAKPLGLCLPRGLFHQSSLLCHSLLFLHLAFKFCGCRGFCSHMCRGIGQTHFQDSLTSHARCFHRNSKLSCMPLGVCYACCFCCQSLFSCQLFSLTLASRFRLCLQVLVRCLSCDFHDLVARAVCSFSCQVALSSSSLLLLSACNFCSTGRFSLQMCTSIC